MDSLTTPCIFCGRDRPLDADTCPSCGRGWIDARLDGHDVPAGEADEETRHPPGGEVAAAATGATAVALAENEATTTSASATASPPDDAPPTPAGGGETVPEAHEPPETAASPGVGPPVAEAPEPPESPKVAPPAPGLSRSTEVVEIGAPETRPAAPPAAAVVTAGTPPAADRPDDPGAPTSNRRTQQLVIGGIVLAIVAVWFGVLAWITRDSGNGESTAGAPTTAVVDTSPATSAAPATSTTVGATTTAPETTTTAPETTTTTIPEIEAIGEPIAVSELGLGAFALGPLDFDSTEALGRLVASFGQPDEVTALEDAALGVCAEETAFAASWGPLTAIFTGTQDESALAGYRLVGDDPTHPASELMTLSGLQVGDTVGDLDATYADFRIAYQEVEGALSFILVRTSDGVTLLWGPVSSEDSDGVVEGIYSPRPCDEGPTPTA